jgi:hypothetical protein
VIKDDPVAGHIFRLSPGRIPRRYLDVSVTVLLLLESVPDRSEAYRGFKEGRYRLDHRLVESMLRVADKKVQWAIVRSPAFWNLPKAVFREHFLRFWRMRRRDAAWRWVLGRALHPFLMNNSPQEGPAYAKTIWALAQDPDENIALTGLTCTGYLGHALTLEQARDLVGMTRGKSMKALAAKSNVGTLYKDFDNLRPQVKAFLLGPWASRILAVNHDPTDTEKWGAHNWCLINMRRALRRSEAGLNVRR